MNDRLRHRIAIVSALVLAGNIAFAAFSPAAAEDQGCPYPVPKCKVQQDCANEPGGCTICYPAPFVGPLCTTHA